MGKILYSILLQATITCTTMYGAEQQALMDEPENPHVIMHMPLAPIHLQVIQHADETDDYLQGLTQVFTELPIFPNDITKIVLSYAQRDREKEKLQKTIQTSLKYHRAARWIALIAGSGCATEMILSSIAIARNQPYLVSICNACNDYNSMKFNAALAGAVISGLPIFLPCGFGTCLDTLDDVTTNQTDYNEITKRKHGRAAIIYSSCSTVALGVFTASLATLVGGNSPEGSAAVLLAGGILGTLSATRLLVKSCLRSRALARRSREIAEE